MARRNWDSIKQHQRVSAAIRAQRDVANYARELGESHRRADNNAQHPARPKAPQSSKAQMREQALAAADAWQLAHPAPPPLPPWGPWTPWRTVTRPDGTTYQERERQRLHPSDC